MTLMLFIFSLQQLPINQLESIFTAADMRAFAQLPSRNSPVYLDLAPILHDRGNVDRDKVLMAFEKLNDRWRVTRAAIINSQSDTNYAWLEIYLKLDLEHREWPQELSVTFAFQFKMAAGRLVMSRWVVQDVQ